MPVILNCVTPDIPCGIAVVRAGQTTIDDCPVLTRINAFLVDEGVQATLEHVFRDRQGKPVDLSFYLDDIPVPGDSLSLSDCLAGGSGVLRIQEALGGSCRFEAAIEGYQASQGVIRAELPEALVARAGLYQLSWGIFNHADNLVAVSDGLLSVERTLFTRADESCGMGPPTVRELRMHMLDSGAADNVLLDDVEFSDEQILLAIRQPVQIWNETPPPIQTFTTQNFPFRFNWKNAIIGQLLIMAAHNYRRNFLQHQAGGINVADKAKEKEYLAAGQQMMAEYREWLTTTKISINCGLFSGQIPSVYSALASGGGGYW